MIIAGVCNGRVRMWHDVPRGRWSGEAAANMYAGPLKRALAEAWPAKRTWRVLEDNDPTGFKSGKGNRAKESAHIDVFEIPRRSPDLNVLDYALWHTINLRMREQERAWPAEKRESKDEYMKRLRRTALSLPTALVKKCVGGMRRRCRLTFAKNGGLFAE